MAYNDKFYLAPEDLYRFGNSTSSFLDRIRPGEVQLAEQNGIEMIVANGAGVSLYSKEGAEKASLAGWVWEIPAQTSFPIGLVLIDDGDASKPGHYTLAPANTMPYAKYVGLLGEVAISCQKVFKKTKVS